MKMNRVMLALAVGVGIAGAEAPIPHKPMEYAGSAELQRIKLLAGKWEGTAVTQGQPAQTVRAEYQITSGGSAVSEKIFVGTPTEMVSIYYDRGGKLAMTHYCAMHNRPQLELTQVTPTALELTLAPNGEVNPSDMHMHALSLDFPSPGKLIQRWTAWQDRKPLPITTLTLTRTK